MVVVKLKKNEEHAGSTVWTKCGTRSPWMVEHAAGLETRYTVNAARRTAYFGVRGHDYCGEIVHFGEAVLIKAPIAASGQKARDRKRKETNACWTKAIWVGKQLCDDMHMVLTSSGLMKVRRLKRLELPGERYERELFAAALGFPWSQMVVHQPT